MKLIGVKKIFYSNLSEYYSEASLQYLYYVVISKVCEIKKEEAILNERFIKKIEVSINNISFPCAYTSSSLQISNNIWNTGA